MTPTTYGRDFAYCLKSHGGVRGFNASLWQFLLRCTLFCHSVATFLTSVSSYEGGCGFEDYEKSNMVPLNIQGGRYRLFGSLQLKPEPVKSYHSDLYKNEFLMRFDMSWKFPDGSVPLRMDFQLYSYLNELNRGKLALSYENEKDLAFSRFVRKLVEKCNCEQEITVVRFDSSVLELSESSFGNIQLQ